MKISVFGLGYVGVVTAGCLSDKGHEIIGVDVQSSKIESLNQGQSPIVEPELDLLIQKAHQHALLSATDDSEKAILNSDLSLICVGTPSNDAGGLDLRYVREVSSQIAEVLAQKSSTGVPHYLVYRSTMLPGSTQALVDEYFHELQERNSIEVFFLPEFLRESTAVADFKNPSLSVIGSRDGLPIPDAVSRIIESDSTTPSRVVNWNTAEMIKYACNAFHATKVTFANEMGRLGKHFKIDSRAVMDLLCQDDRLNLSPYYLRPGNPFGGSCLPKDLRALIDSSRRHGLSLPMSENLLISNQVHLDDLIRRIERSGEKEIILLGLSFKNNTDDLRESSMVEVAQFLLGRGYTLRIYDPHLNVARLVGSNKRVLESKMPHLAAVLIEDPRKAIGERGLIVAAQKNLSMGELKDMVTEKHRILDVNGWDELKDLSATYEGFCW
ncbi:MAG TPA: UDP-glucose/GDP-mannose dehydrogenase family protein [Verrucomicrobiales bacterium]|nr:UDP-glucose/GDP-mannose dehydrogenase family protein [Verrucomicrobiales bacterium]HIL70783.1 UDP-glucose/GDP-mannose dehydrogenase family protein [Verrucomicrobiota bacterium]